MRELLKRRRRDDLITVPVIDQKQSLLEKPYVHQLEWMVEERQARNAAIRVEITSENSQQ